MNKRTFFLFGLLLGQGIMIPYILLWKKHPVVEAVPFSSDVLNSSTERSYVIHKVPNRQGFKSDLRIHLTSQQKMQEIYKKLSGVDEPNLMGFYDPNTHQIITVDSTDILIHEIRHVFEGPWHQGPQNAHRHK